MDLVAAADAVAQGIREQLHGQDRRRAEVRYWTEWSRRCSLESPNLGQEAEAQVLATGLKQAIAGALEEHTAATAACQAADILEGHEVVVVQRVQIQKIAEYT